MATVGRVQQQPRRLDRVTGDGDIARPLKPPSALTAVMHAGRQTGLRVGFDTADHRQIADLGPGGNRARNPSDQRALLGIGRAPRLAETAIDAGRRPATRRRNSGERRRGPGELRGTSTTERLAN
jgi:hypothetical protein